MTYLYESFIYQKEQDGNTTWTVSTTMAGSRISISGEAPRHLWSNSEKGGLGEVVELFWKTN